MMNKEIPARKYLTHDLACKGDDYTVMTIIEARKRSCRDLFKSILKENLAKGIENLTKKPKS